MPVGVTESDDISSTLLKPFFSLAEEALGLTVGRLCGGHVAMLCPGRRESTGLQVCSFVI